MPFPQATTAFIGLLILFEGEEVYVPCYPSSINVLLPSISIQTVSIIKEFQTTVNGLKNIYKMSNKEILCLPKYKVVNDRMIVGLITLTNQFVPVIPETYQEMPQGWKGDKDENGLLLFVPVEGHIQETQQIIYSNMVIRHKVILIGWIISV